MTDIQITEFDKLWDYNNPAETEKKFRGILPEIEKTGDRNIHLQLLTQIARTNGLQMKFDEAHKILDEVERQLNDDLKIVKLRYLLERGRVYNSSKKKEKAKELFLKAFELGKEIKEYNLTVDAAHMMAIVESDDEALKWNETAMQIAENSGDEKAKGWLGSLYNNTGWTYFEKKDYDKALQFFEKCLKWQEERNKSLGIFIAKWSVAKTLRMKGKTDDAIEIQTALLKEIEDGKAEEDGYVYEELGECNLIKENTEKAKKYFKKAYELLSKDIWVAENEKDRLQRIKELSE